MATWLNENQVASYNKNGFVAIHEILSEQIIEKLLLASQYEIAAKENGNWVSNDKQKFYSNIVAHKVNLWRINDDFQNVAFNQDLARIAQKLMGCYKVRLFQDQILIKNGPTGQATKWHQDLPVWPFDDSRALTFWIPLQSVNKNNGTLQFIPQSHTLGKLKHLDINSARYPINGIRTKPHIAKLKKGSVHIHNSLTVHYAFTNITETPRYAYTLIYIPEDTTSNGQYYFANPRVPKGSKFDNTNYPIIETNSAT